MILKTLIKMDDNIYGQSDTGRIRDNNEDTFIAEIITGDLLVGAAIDGVGGYSGGEIAAALAKETILSFLNKENKNILSALSASIKLANEKIFEERQKVKEHDKMACVLTVAVADLNNNKFYYAHVGDTRLYLYRDGGLVKVSRDHSVVGFLEDSGRITEEEAMRHPKRNEINKALGFEHHETADEKFMDTGTSPFLPGDLLLLCSDGLTDMINQKEIITVLEMKVSLKEKTNLLIEKANNAGGRDNITVVLIMNNKTPVSYLAIKPETKHELKTEEAKTEEDPVAHSNEVPGKKGSSTKRLFATFAILAFIIAGFIYYDLYLKKQIIKPAVAALIFKNTQQILQDSLKNTRSNTLIFPFSDTVVILKDSLIIDKDSIHITGNGILLKADSVYKGAAFIIQPNCKYVLLDSMTLKNFNIGILVKQKGLHLHNIHFENCKVPIQYQYLNTKDSSAFDSTKKQPLH